MESLLQIPRKVLQHAPQINTGPVDPAVFGKQGCGQEKHCMGVPPLSARSDDSHSPAGCSKGEKMGLREGPGTD